MLEVGSLGFRLLRPTSEDPLSLFPWGQIHSWAHGTNRFTFRYFDDGSVQSSMLSLLPLLTKITLLTLSSLANANRHAVTFTLSWMHV